MEGESQDRTNGLALLETPVYLHRQEIALDARLRFQNTDRRIQRGKFAAAVGLS